MGFLLGKVTPVTTLQLFYSRDTIEDIPRENSKREIHRIQVLYPKQGSAGEGTFFYIFFTQMSTNGAAITYITVRVRIPFQNVPRHASKSI